MLKTLSPSLETRLKSRFHDHPLWLTCQKVFHHYMASIDWNSFTSEHLFIKVAEVLDAIFYDPMSAKGYIHSLWDDLKIKFKTTPEYLTNGNPSQQDLDTVCGILFYTVAAVLSLHWRSLYKEEIVGMLRDEVREKGMFKNVEEEHNIIKNLCMYSEGLEDWVIKYSKDQSCLSDEISYALSVDATNVNAKVIPDFTPTGKTFSMTTKIIERQLTMIAQRLTQANRLDPDCPMDDWLKLFSGTDEIFTIKWLGHPGELRDLFKMLTDKKTKQSTGYITPKYDYQIIVRSHFVDKDGNYFKDLRGQKSIDEFSPILDDCKFMLECMITKVTSIMRVLMMEHQAELEEMGIHYNTTAAKKSDGQRVRNKRQTKKQAI